MGQGCLFQGHKQPPLPYTTIATTIWKEACSLYTKTVYYHSKCLLRPTSEDDPDVYISNLGLGKGDLPRPIRPDSPYRPYWAALAPLALATMAYRRCGQPATQELGFPQRWVVGAAAAATAAAAAGACKEVQGTQS